MLSVSHCVMIHFWGDIFKSVALIDLDFVSCPSHPNCIRHIPSLNSSGALTERDNKWRRSHVFMQTWLRQRARSHMQAIFGFSVMFDWQTNAAPAAQIDCGLCEAECVCLTELQVRWPRCLMDCMRRWTESSKRNSGVLIASDCLHQVKPRFKKKTFISLTFSFQCPQTLLRFSR